MKPKTYRIGEIYQDYVKKILSENPEYWSRYSKTQKTSNYWVYRKEYNNGNWSVVEVISYPVFKEILTEYFVRAKEAIIAGAELNLGNDLGIIAARRVERNHKNKAVNWAETNKQPKNEKGKPSKIIYYTDDDWCRIGWVKSGKLKNHKNYQFVPTPDDARGGGFVKEFSRALMLNPLLKYKYKYYPYILDSKEDDL